MTNTPRMDKARMILAAMSPDMIDDIFQLFSIEGRAIIGQLSNDTRNNDIPQFLGMFSDSYIGAKDFKYVWIGFGAVTMAEMRKVDFSNDRWEKIAKDAFSLPDSMAAAIGKRVETYDIMTPSKDADPGMWNNMSTKLAESARQALNWGASVLQLPYEIDQNQKYDVDFLFELGCFGRAVEELNTRARLMNAQAKIAAGMNLIVTASGDPNDDPQDAADRYVGDVLARVSARTLPPHVTGGLAPLASLGRTATAAQAVTTMRDAGYSVTGTNTVSAGKPRNPLLKRAVDKVMNMAPGKSILLGASLGLLPNVVSLVSDVIKNRQRQGDPDLYGDVAAGIGDLYGDTIRDAWAAGDIDSLAKMILGDVLEDESTGDPAQDDMIRDMVYGDIEQDLGDLDPEVGGLFTRFRTNWAIRRAANKRRRATKRAGKMRKRQGRADAFARAQEELTAADTYANPGQQEFEEYTAPEYEEQEMAPEGDFGAAAGFSFPE